MAPGPDFGGQRAGGLQRDLQRELQRLQPDALLSTICNRQVGSAAWRPTRWPICTSLNRYKGQEVIKRDVENVKNSVANAKIRSRRQVPPRCSKYRSCGSRQSLDDGAVDKVLKQVPALHAWCSASG
jgi:hypothetical protein